MREGHLPVEFDDIVDMTFRVGDSNEGCGSASGLPNWPISQLRSSHSCKQPLTPFDLLASRMLLFGAGAPLCSIILSNMSFFHSMRESILNKLAAK